MKRVPSYLDEAIAKAQKGLGRPTGVDEKVKKKIIRPSLLELNHKKKPKVSLPLRKPSTKSWLSKTSNLTEENYYSKKNKKTPIWRLALDDVNSKEIEHNKELNENKNQIISWPPLLSLSSVKTLENWLIVEENRQLTKTMEKIIERPGGHINPIHIVGNYGVGKTHICFGTSYDIQSIYGLDSVRIILSGTLTNNSQELPKLPQNIPNLKMIVIENYEELLTNQSRMQIISNWISWNVNNGVQILITSNGSIDNDSIGGETKRLLESSIKFKIEEYSNSSKIRMLRRLAVKRNVVISDEHLSILISTKKNLPSLLSSFEKLIIAQKDGSLPTDPKEAIASLDSVETIYNSLFKDDLSSAAKNLAQKAVESTNHNEFEFEPYEISIDINPENISDISETNSEAKKLIEKDSETISKWKENLNLNESIEVSNDKLNELSEHGLNRMVDVGLAFEKYNDILESFEVRMKNISKSLENSDTETLLHLADEISDLEYSLQELKPLISTLDNNKLNIKPEENIDLPNLQKLKKLDEYIPENEWNIDSDQISMDDLLNEGELNPISHSVLLPTNFTISEEE